jgi:peptide/nickel transport system substrate-binding protein
MKMFVRRHGSRPGLLPVLSLGFAFANVCNVASEVIMRRLSNVFMLFLALILSLSACASSTPPAPAAQPTEVPAAQATEAPAAPQATEAPAAPQATEAAAPTAAPVAAGSFSQSPSLEEQVSAGKLPPVEERLPKNPQVITPLVDAGQYGGTLRQGVVGNSLTWGGMLYVAQWENLVQWNPEFTDVEPSIAEKIEVSEDAREYTFYFREGMKWSDGEPFGVEDVLFYINDVLRNEELNPGGFAPEWVPEGLREGFKVEQVGPNALKMSFDKPYGTLLFNLAAWGGRQFAQYPKHYLQQFHKNYNPDVDTLVKEDSTLQDWTGLFFKKGPDTWGNPDRFMDVPEYPSLGPWVVVQPLGSGTTAKFTRNPYYWKVDDQGKQLPYIDEIVVTAYQDAETRTLAMLNGDLDMIKDPGEGNREVYYDALAQGKPIKIAPVIPDGGNTISVHFNQASKNPVLREIFGNRDFRIGMSHAINRTEIIEVVFKGQGDPAQVSPLPDSPLYNEKLANQYLEYDVAKANEYLDKVLPDKDANGMRLAPDGSPLSIIWTCLDGNYTGGDAKAWLQAAELMVGYFKEVGVDVKLDVVSDQVLTERRAENNVDMFIFHGGEGGAGMAAIIDPRWHIPGEYWGYFSLGYYVALNGTDEEKAASGIEEVPENILAYREAFQLATQEATLEGQIEAMKKVLDASAEAFWVLGISRPAVTYQPFSSRLHNFPDNSTSGWIPGTLKFQRPEQWYILEQ